MESKLKEAIELRKSGNPEVALELILELLKSAPNNPDYNYQAAWTCDSMGKESEAVPFYESALSNGLKEDRAGAYLGLGSTYRCLGNYQDSERVFAKAIEEFPDNKALKVFSALTKYNLKKYTDSVFDLLILLLDTTNDSGIKSYEKALRFYADKLDQTWN